MSTRKSKKCFVVDPISSACRKFLAISLDLEAFFDSCLEVKHVD